MTDSRRVALAIADFRRRLPDQQPPPALDERIMNLRVMSFNIRYGTAADGPNSWSERRNLVLEAIGSFAPDVLGLQEALDFQVGFLARQLPFYSYVGCGREDGRTAGEFTPVFFRTARFQLRRNGQFWLSETPEAAGSKGWGASHPRIVTWAVLADTHSGQEVAVLNTHFTYHSDAARVASANLLCQKAREIAVDRMIVMGDFNATEDDETYRRLLEDFPEAPGNLLDSYRQAHPQRRPAEATRHDFGQVEAGSRIDWILHSVHLATCSAAIDRFEKSGRFPSDHFPVTAVLRPK